MPYQSIYKVLYISIGLTFASNDCREAVLVVGWKTQSAGRSTGARSGAGLRGRSRRRKATESSQTTRTAASVAAAARLDTLHRCLHSARVHRSKVQLALDPETSDKQRCPATGTKLYCLVTEAHVCEQLDQGRYLTAARP